MSVETPKQLTIEQVKAIFNELITRLNEDKVSDTINSIKEDYYETLLVEIMPILFEIQGTVMSQYGFTVDDDGYQKFSEVLTTFENEPSIKPLADEFKNLQKSYTSIDPKMFEQYNLFDEANQKEMDEFEDDIDDDDIECAPDNFGQ